MLPYIQYWYFTASQTLLCIGVTLGHIMLQIPGGECHFVTCVAESAGGSSYLSLQGGCNITFHSNALFILRGS